MPTLSAIPFPPAQQPHSQPNWFVHTRCESTPYPPQHALPAGFRSYAFASERCSAIVAQ